MGITVLLANTVAGVRQIARALLEKEPDVEIVGEAAGRASGDDAQRRPAFSLVSTGNR